MAIPIVRSPIQIEYPSSDGLPLAESDFQLNPLIYAVDALRAYFRDRADVYVAGNMFVYYEQGNPEAVVAPDVFVVRGTAKRDRSSYFLWEEPKGPDFVLEITSRSTRSKDQGPKRGTYAFLGVREYVLYDPTHDYLHPPLQGWRLAGENYQRVPTDARLDSDVVVYSEVLGLELRLEGEILRFYEPTTGRRLLSYEESEQARQAAEVQLERERAARRMIEARLAELEARSKAQEGR